MRTDTAYDMLRQITRDFPNDFQTKFEEKVLGKIVLTSYNNRTYKVDGVNFNISPNSTFPRRGGTDITIKQYYLKVMKYIIIVSYFVEIQFSPFHGDILVNCFDFLNTNHHYQRHHYKIINLILCFFFSNIRACKSKMKINHY